MNASKGNKRKKRRRGAFFTFSSFSQAVCFDSIIIFFRRSDCSESCKLRKQMLETECKQLRRELTATDELKKSAEQQSRNYEQEVVVYLHLFNENLFNFVHFFPISCENLKLNFVRANHVRVPRC